MRINHAVSEYNTATCRENPTCTAWPHFWSGALYPELWFLCCANWIIRCSPTLPPPAARVWQGLVGGAGCQELLGDPHGVGRAAPPSPQEMRAAQEPLPMVSSSKGQPPAAPALGWSWASAPNLQELEDALRAWHRLAVLSCTVSSWEGCGERVKSCKRTWHNPLRAHTASVFNPRPVFNLKLRAGIRYIVTWSRHSAFLVLSTRKGEKKELSMYEEGC